MNPATSTSIIGSFSRSQVAGLVASAVDFGILFGLAEIFHVYYVIAVAIGALAGAVTSFLMNRHWSFRVITSRCTGKLSGTDGFLP